MIAARDRPNERLCILLPYGYWPQEASTIFHDIHWFLWSPDRFARGIHANVRWRLGPLEEVISSPAFHHWHHTLEDHKDHNYSSMLPVMDRVFGTFYLPKAWPADYGTSTPMPHTLAGQILDPFAPTPTPRTPQAEVSSSKGSTPSLSEQPRPS